VFHPSKANGKATFMPSENISPLRSRGV